MKCYTLWVAFAFAAVSLAGVFAGTPALATKQHPVEYSGALDNVGDEPKAEGSCTWYWWPGGYTYETVSCRFLTTGATYDVVVGCSGHASFVAAGPNGQGNVTVYGVSQPDAVTVYRVDSTRGLVPVLEYEPPSPM